MTKTYSKTRILVEGALMIALSTVLSMIQIPLMPHGGSITLFSMVPILVMSYRHGAKWGIMTAFVNSLIQLVQGLGNLAYCQTLTAQVGCVLLDYLLAYGVLGVAGFFWKRKSGLFTGTVVACICRFIIHFISGITIYKIYEPTEVLNHVYTNPYLYSAVYNGSFLAIDMVLCLIIFAILYKPLNRYITAQDLNG